jgi:peptidoglycan hydrolase-like protein with peptidoglycan-binding domain
MQWHRKLATVVSTLVIAASSIAMAGFSASADIVTTAQLEAVHPAMRQVLSYSDQGHWVMTLQADLNLLGYHSGPVDGIFGPKTEAAVKSFQSAHNLSVTGATDPATWQDILAGFHLTPPYQRQGTSSTGASSTGSSVGQTSTNSSGPQMIDGRPVIAVYHMIATAYGPSLKDNYPYGPVDAFGQPLQSGMVAVDPSVVPLKSYVYVQGYHDSNLASGGFLGHAMDTGGAIKGDRIDIFMNANPTTVSNFGIQPVTVYLLGN